MDKANIQTRTKLGADVQSEDKEAEAKS